MVGDGVNDEPALAQGDVGSAIGAGFVLRPEVGAISMAGSSIIVALNAVALKRLQLPKEP